MLAFLSSAFVAPIPDDIDRCTSWLPFSRNCSPREGHRGVPPNFPLFLAGGILRFSDGRFWPTSIRFFLRENLIPFSA